MKPRSIPYWLLLALGAFAGGFFCALERHQVPIRREVETLTETVTVFHGVQIEAERSTQATERIIERRIAVPCRYPQASAPQTAMQEAPKKEAPVGTVVMEERILERAAGTSERLRLGALDAAAASIASESQKAEAVSPVSVPRWRLSALAGYDWTDAVPVYGLSTGMRLVGPVEIGVWFTVSQRLHGAVGLSVSAAW